MSVVFFRKFRKTYAKLLMKFTEHIFHFFSKKYVKFCSRIVKKLYNFRNVLETTPS